jgi:hypothetical protein
LQKAFRGDYLRHRDSINHKMAKALYEMKMPESIELPGLQAL